MTSYRELLPHKIITPTFSVTECTVSFNYMSPVKKEEKGYAYSIRHMQISRINVSNFVSISDKSVYPLCIFYDAFIQMVHSVCMLSDTMVHQI